MNAIELFLENGQSAQVFACGQCRHIARSKLLAEQCCRNTRCKKCGRDSGHKFMSLCDSCGAEQIRLAEQEKFDAAEKIQSWDGWVYDGLSYYSSVDALADLADELPEYVWPCKGRPFVTNVMPAILQHIFKSYENDFNRKSLAGLPELEAAVKIFEARNSEHITHTPDFSKVLVLPQKP